MQLNIFCRIYSINPRLCHKLRGPTEYFYINIFSFERKNQNIILSEMYLLKHFLISFFKVAIKYSLQDPKTSLHYASKFCFLNALIYYHHFIHEFLSLGLTKLTFAIGSLNFYYFVLGMDCLICTWLSDYCYLVFHEISLKNSFMTFLEKGISCIFWLLHFN